MEATWKASTRTYQITLPGRHQQHLQLLEFRLVVTLSNTDRMLEWRVAVNAQVGTHTQKGKFISTRGNNRESSNAAVRCPMPAKYA